MLAKLILKDQNLLGKRLRVEVSKEMINNVAQYLIFIKRINPDDGVWVYEHDNLATKLDQSSEWRSINEPKTKNQNSVKALEAIPDEAHLRYVHKSTSVCKI